MDIYAHKDVDIFLRDRYEIGKWGCIILAL